MVRLEKALLYPYRCIESPQELELTESVTALVGRNEAGKTTVLELLASANYYNREDARFHYDLLNDYPRRKRRELEQTGNPPAAALTYRVSDETLEAIRRDVGMDEQDAAFTRVVYYDGSHQISDNGFTYDPYAFWTAFAAQKAPGLASMKKTLAGLHTKEEFDRFYKKAAPGMNESERAALSEAGRFFENLHGWDNPINEYVFRRYLLPCIPKFLFYDECCMLLSRICLDQVYKAAELTASERTAKAFLALLGIPMETLLQAKDLSTCKAELELVQAELSQKFLSVWSGNQNLRIELALSRELEKSEAPRRLFHFGRRKEDSYRTYLDIRVTDVQRMISLPLESRSKGFRWFFSFWSWFQAIQKTETAPFILLLDEPGLHLHEDAQSDLIKFLYSLSDSYQLVYTTHSPFMMKNGADSFYRIMNDGNGSVLSREKSIKQIPMPLARHHDK